MTHAEDRAGLACSRCGSLYPRRNDVIDFLQEPHAVVAREQRAVATLDGEDRAAEERLRGLLVNLDQGRLSEQARRDFSCLEHAIQSLGQVRDLLQEHPLSPGECVLELGADHCWTSNLFLDAGCRVIALDITDHLELAARGSDADLCRIKADMNFLPLAPGSVDVVWATAAAHHSWDLATCFREAARVLRAGGRLVFCCEPMPSWPRYVTGKDFGREERELGINETWLPRSKWTRLCSAAGLRPRLAFPRLEESAIEKRLAQRHLPVFLAPLLRPLLPLLQVSIHLLATKPS